VGNRLGRGGAVLVGFGILFSLLVFLATSPGQDPFNITPNTWVQKRPTYIGAPDGGSILPQGWNWEGLYDPGSQRVVVWERWEDSVRGDSIYANSLLAYDPVANVVTVLKLNNWKKQEGPGGTFTTEPLPANATDPTPVDRHPLGLLALVPERNRIYLANGLNQTAPGGHPEDTWMFDLAGGRWTKVSDSAQTHPPRDVVGPGQTMVYDPLNRVIAYFHPRDTGTETWLFDPNTHQWRRLTMSPSAAGVFVQGAGVGYDSQRNRILFYGGDIFNEMASRRLWAYSVSTNTWTRLRDCPAPAIMPGFDYDSTHDVFVALITETGATWTYDPRADNWTQGPNGGAATRIGSLTYDPAHDVFVYQGGSWDNPQWALFRYQPPGSPGTSPPTVAITAPANGAILSGTVTISADASDDVGVVGVQFRLNGANLGAEDNSAPYATQWDTTTVPNGQYTLTAAARDAAGNFGVSEPVLVTVNNTVPPDSTPPTVSIAEPADGSTVNGVIRVTANATDNVGVVGVQFRLDGNNLGAEDMTAPYSVLLDTAAIANGLHTLTAVGRDAAGNSSTSPALTIAVSNNASSCGTGLTDASRGIAQPEAPRPALLSTYVDSNFGGCVMRVTDTNVYRVGNPVPTYSQLQAWNADQKRLMLATGHLLDAQTYALLEEFFLSTPRWSPVDPNTIYGVRDNSFVKYDIVSRSFTTLRTFTEYANLDRNASFEELSRDGRYVALVGERASDGRPEFFWYDIVNDVKGPVHDGQPAGGCGRPDWVAMSPKGDYVLVQWGGGFTDDRFCALEAYDLNMNYVGKVSNGNGHSDNAIGRDGTQWSVEFYITDQGRRVIQKNRIPRGRDEFLAGDATASVSLIEVDWSLDGHISCQAHGTGFCVLSTYQGTPESTRDDWKPFENEVLKVYLDSTLAQPHIQRMAHTHSDVQFILPLPLDECPVESYWAQPHATVSRDGTKAIFGSSWGPACRAESYVVELGAAAPGDTTPPTVYITNPADGTTVSGMITVSAEAADEVGVVGVQFQVDGSNLGAEDTSAPYSTPWDTRAAPNGLHTLTAVARDAAGNTRISAAITVTVSNSTDTIPPTASLTAPANNATLSGSVVISANASDNVGVAGVQFRVDGVNLGPEDTSEPFTAPWDTTTVANGQHTLTAVARDASGNTTTSEPVVVTVSNNSPPLDLSPGNLVTGETDALTQFRIDARELDAAVASCPACQFRSADDLISGQTLEVRLRSSTTPAMAEQIILKQGTINGTVASVGASQFVLQTPSGGVWPSSVRVVVTPNVTRFVNIAGIAALQPGQTVAVRGLLFKAGPQGGPALLVSIVEVRAP